jgi:cell volume regulation protein A
MLANLTVNEILGLVGLLLVIGFLADYLFKKTNFPDILVLLGIGYLIGPVLQVIDPAKLMSASQLIASVALVIIIFSGGIEFDFSRLVNSAPRAILIAVLGVIFSIATIAVPAYYLFNWKLLDSLLLGSIVGGTSSAIVIALVTRASVPKQVSSLLSLESVLNSPLVIVLALVLLEAVNAGQAGISLSDVLRAIAIRFSLGITVGTLMGLLWLWLLSLMQKENYNDIVTIAIVFLLFYVVEWLNGSGVIFALIFGIILGNGIGLTKLLRFKHTIESTGVMKGFTAQIYFFIKTFFFIYLGSIISFSQPINAIFGVGAAFILLFVRFFAVLLSSIGNRVLLSNKGALTTMLARGESSAVLVQIVAASQIPNAATYPDIVMAIIITTTVISALGVVIFARKDRPIEESPQAWA